MSLLLYKVFTRFDINALMFIVVVFSKEYILYKAHTSFDINVHMFVVVIFLKNIYYWC